MWTDRLVPLDEAQVDRLQGTLGNIPMSLPIILQNSFSVRSISHDEPEESRIRKRVNKADNTMTSSSEGTVL